jgi:signal transduction histidine kinase
MYPVKEFFSNLFDQSSWPARWHCGHWSGFHGWLYILSDLSIWVAYFTIPVLIIRYISKKKTIRFHKAYVYFAAFILLCGLTHLIDAAMFWAPVYRLNALIRFFTAVVSWFTVYHLFKLLPSFNSVKTAEELEAEIRRDALLIKEVESANIALKTQNALIENIFNATIDHTNVFDTELNWISVNTVTQKLLNKPRAEILGKNFKELFPASVGSEYHDDLLTAASGIAIPNKIGSAPSKRIYESSFQPLFENGMQYGILVISRDITDKMMREAALKSLNDELHMKNGELLKMNSELEHFMYTLSHDLQEPLRKIQIYSDLASHAGAGGANDQIAKIKKSAARMKALIVDVLDYAKTGQTEGASEKVSLDHIVAAVLVDLELTIAEKKAVVQSLSLPEVQGIKYQLTQVFYNLVANAMKYCEKEPCLEITHKTISKTLDGEEKNYVEISFKDNGIGFDEQYKKEIFSPFKRLQTKFEGTGIGLALVKKIIENHKGYVDVESKAGEGSVFKIGLPV